MSQGRPSGENPPGEEYASLGQNDVEGSDGKRSSWIPAFFSSMRGVAAEDPDGDGDATAYVPLGQDDGDDVPPPAEEPSQRSFFERMFGSKRGAGTEGESEPRDAPPPAEDTAPSTCVSKCADLFPALSYEARVLGCLFCVVAGWAISFGSFVRIAEALVGKPFPLVFSVSFGNILGLCGSCFLSGPTVQAQRMFDPTRKMATLVYIGSMALTIAAMIALHRAPGILEAPVLIILLLLQCAAVTWYCLSYIPFARRMVQRCISSFTGGGNDGNGGIV
eukprot:CAMPEP_0194265820 /NCGR_PEP_ID=MMETSP0169-20130528/935_1 /TAXON_ID=218684 /ORGANISM="Corethron pennatum, Strain L29A3" /LENGTH=276 /DNA_ID=CAMNT_0039006371 /DNA_START=90 /DNA_END=920 /DNA_ORIENTATION=+